MAIKFYETECLITLDALQLYLGQQVHAYLVARNEGFDMENFSIPKIIDLIEKITLEEAGCLTTPVANLMDRIENQDCPLVMAVELFGAETNLPYIVEKAKGE